MECACAGTQDDGHAITTTNSQDSTSSHYSMIMAVTLGLLRI
jgi:hypothetical protein